MVVYKVVKFEEAKAPVKSSKSNKPEQERKLAHYYHRKKNLFQSKDNEKDEKSLGLCSLNLSERKSDNDLETKNAYIRSKSFISNNLIELKSFC